MNEKDSSYRSHKFSSPPDGYVRRQTIFNTIGAAVGILGSVLGMFGAYNYVRDYIDRRISEERSERIEQSNFFTAQLNECCRKKR